MISYEGNHLALCLFTSHSDSILRLLEECDTAIARAVKSGDKKLGDTNERFDQAIRKLRAYAREFHAT
jgi:hypothetical protein